MIRYTAFKNGQKQPGTNPASLKIRASGGKNFGRNCIGFACNVRALCDRAGQRPPTVPRFGRDRRERRSPALSAANRGAADQPCGPMSFHPQSDCRTSSTCSIQKLVPAPKNRMMTRHPRRLSGFIGTLPPAWSAATAALPTDNPPAPSPSSSRRW